MVPGRGVCVSFIIEIGNNGVCRAATDGGMVAAGAEGGRQDGGMVRGCGVIMEHISGNEMAGIQWLTLRLS